MQKLTTKKTF